MVALLQKATEVPRGIPAHLGFLAEMAILAFLELLAPRVPLEYVSFALHQKGTSLLSMIPMMSSLVVVELVNSRWVVSCLVHQVPPDPLARPVK